MNDYCPGAELDLQGNGGGLNTSLPPRFVWHITWDALKPDGSQPQFSAVDNYLQGVGYCPHIMWNPFTGYIKQYYPASQSARALAAWNGDGAVCVQIEVFFTPGCVVNGVRYDTVADTPLKGFDTLLAWADSLGVPRAWPLGAPQWSGNSRDPDVWNNRAGHYGHCNVPDNTHTDPGPMPDLNRITTQSTPIEGFLMALNDQDQQNIYEAQGRIDAGVAKILDAIGTIQAKTANIPLDVLTARFPLRGGGVANVAGALAEISTKPVTVATAGAVDIDALVERLKAELPAALLAELTTKLSQ